MATRSRIALQLNSEALLSVYHHWDGYPQWLGVTLNEKFNTREKVAELIDGGDMSSCDSDNVYDYEKQAFVKRDPQPEYYNDRGENTEPRLDLNFDDYAANATSGEEFLYVFTLDHQWECYEICHDYDDQYNVTGTNIVPRTIPTELPEESVA